MSFISQRSLFKLAVQHLIGQRRYRPRLSQMAIDILSIPAMSAEPERVFSGARRTISWERMQLGRDNIEKIECLKSWIRNNIAVEALEDDVDD